MPASNGKNEVYELKTKIKVKEDTIVYFIIQYRDWNDDTKNKCALYKDSKLKKKMFNIDIQCNGSYRVAYLEKGSRLVSRLSCEKRNLLFKKFY